MPTFFKGETKDAGSQKIAKLQILKVMFHYEKMKNSFPKALSESRYAWHKEYWSLCSPVCKTGSCEANLIPSVHLGNIMDSYVSDGLQRVANRKQQVKGTFTGTMNGWSKKAQLNLETAKEDYQCQETLKQQLQEDPKKLWFYFSQQFLTQNKF